MIPTSPHKLGTPENLHCLGVYFEDIFLGGLFQGEEGCDTLNAPMALFNGEGVTLNWFKWRGRTSFLLKRSTGEALELINRQPSIGMFVCRKGRDVK